MCQGGLHVTGFYRTLEGQVRIWFEHAVACCALVYDSAPAVHAQETIRACRGSALRVRFPAESGIVQFGALGTAAAMPTQPEQPAEDDSRDESTHWDMAR